jgi:alpha-L-fucosidase
MNLVREGVINYKHDAYLFGTAVPDVERGQFAEVKPYTWQTDTSIGFDSWGYTTDNRYKKAEDILCDLVDIVSKNGNMLLNIGPKVRRNNYACRSRKFCVPSESG